MGTLKITIQHGDISYEPIVQENVSLETERQGSAGKLKFNMIEDNAINFTEGDSISLLYGGKELFFGFIFSKKRSKNKVVSVTAYDQLRYLKNKDTCVYENKTAGELIEMIANDFKLTTGAIENTVYKIPSRVEDNEELFQMIQNALNLTLENTNKMYVLYDEYKKITLKSLENMFVPIMLDTETVGNFDYESSIDKQTYNKIKLIYDNEEKGESEVYMVEDSTNINKWGVLQKCDTIKKHENKKIKADALLALYNKKTKRLQVKNALGDIRIRGGSLFYFNMDLGDVKVANLMLVEKCVHIFKENEHLMNLTLRGGDFNGQ